MILSLGYISDPNFAHPGQPLHRPKVGICKKVRRRWKIPQENHHCQSVMDLTRLLHTPCNFCRVRKINNCRRVGRRSFRMLWPLHADCHCAIISHSAPAFEILPNGYEFDVSIAHPVKLLPGLKIGYCGTNSMMKFPGATIVVGRCQIDLHGARAFETSSPTWIGSITDWQQSRFIAIKACVIGRESRDRNNVFKRNKVKWIKLGLKSNKANLLNSVFVRKQ